MAHRKCANGGWEGGHGSLGAGHWTAANLARNMARGHSMDIDLTPFLNAGIPGLVLLWFMLRLERILSRFDNGLRLGS